MAYLRLTPTDYRAVVSVHNRLDITHPDIPTFRFSLALTLADCSPALAERVRLLTDAQAMVLRDHLQGERAGSARLRLGPDEWRTVALACRRLPLSARFARPLQGMLVRYFRDSSPDLARKVGRLGAKQFDWLLDQVRRRLREGA